MFLISIGTFTLFKKLSRDGKTLERHLCWKWWGINYSLILLYITTFGRRSWDYYRYNFAIGYSYRSTFILGDTELLTEILLNIAIFIPLGIIGFFAFHKYKVIRVCIYGLLLSVIIEVSQLAFKKGTFEFDDMISNTVGTLIGALVTLLISKLIQYIRKLKSQ